MNKADCLLICWNHRDVMLKQTQKEPFWSFVLRFIIIFSHFSLSAISQAYFHIEKNLYHYASLILICRKNVMGEYLNIYRIIHSFVVYGWCWSMLLCRDLTLNWFLILFSSIELFLISKTKYSIKHDNWKWSILE